MDIKKQEVRTGGSLSWEEREAMIKEYLTGHYTKIELWKKYTGQEAEHGHILRWMRRLGYIPKAKAVKRKKKFLHSQKQPPVTLDTENSDKTPMELQKRIKELERQLENAELKVEGYELMIEIAEKELKIPIRKKSGTK